MKSYPKDEVICRERAAHAELSSVIFGESLRSYDCYVVIVKVTSFQ